MNTIGKKGKLGEHIRCVVSVAMLTEGWDANTVTHILGIRPFRSQLLCEQVVGRGLRRRSYAVDAETGRFEPEYAEVYGVPFAFIPGDRQISQAARTRGPPSRCEPCPTLGARDPLPQARRLPGRAARRAAARRIRRRLEAAPRPGSRSPCGSRTRASSAPPSEVDLDDIRNARIAARRLRASPRRWCSARSSSPRTTASSGPGCSRSWSTICRRWLDECVTADPGVTIGYLLLTQACARAAEKVFGSIARYPGQPCAASLHADHPPLRPDRLAPTRCAS